MPVSRTFQLLHACSCVLACSPDAESVGSDPSTSTTDPTTPGSTGLSEPTSAPDQTDTTGDATGSTSSTGAPSDTSESASACGDGTVDPGEQCDDGFAANTETGSCLPTCTLNVCGDGFVLQGIEQCDLGDDNSHEYAGCVPGTCHWGPNCGDGVVTPGHEICDPGAPVDPMDDVVPCEPTCRYDGRVVFLSSVPYDGDLDADDDDDIVGVANADLECQTLAKTFDLENYPNYRAWLSDGASEPAETFAHGAEFADTPYVLLNGVQIAASFDDLLLHGPTVGITITDDHTTIVNANVWTHTTFAGENIPGDYHCAQWTANDFKSIAQVGKNYIPDDKQTWQSERWWTRYTENTCDTKNYLYCFEN